MTQFNTLPETYVFSDGDERDRLVTLHDSSKPNFLKILQRVLDDYGLAHRLEQAQQANTKVEILDVGCGEGLYLHDLAQILEARGFLAAADLNGIDRDATSLELAKDFRTVLQPPRPYLNFYVHDIRMPFEENAELKAVNKLQFDFIYATLVLEHIPNAQKIEEMLYQHLKPGGVIYLRNTMLGEGDTVAPTPSMYQPTRAFQNFIANLNEGVDIAVQTQHWLAAFGAVQIQNFEDVAYANSDSQLGLATLQNWVLAIRNSLPKAVQSGRMTQEQSETLLDTILQELNGDPRGYWKQMDTLACKP